MIPARKRRWLRWMFRRHVVARVYRTFGTVQIRGLDRMAEAIANGSVLVVANHTAWWDALMAVAFAEHFAPADTYAMMDAENLKRHPFFAALGAFGVDRNSARDGARAIAYAVERLATPGTVVWIFPQGEERPTHERPLHFFRGAARVAQRGGCTVLPVAFQYVFTQDERPDVYVSIGAPVRDADADAQAVAVERELQHIDAELSQRGQHGFVSLPRRQAKGNTRPLAERLLGMLTPVRALPPARPDPNDRAHRAEACALATGRDG